jgi:hypothetical protein
MAEARDVLGWDWRIRRERERERKIRKGDCHVGPTCEKESRGLMFGALAGVRRKNNSLKIK